MHIHKPLPVPSPQALAHSERLLKKIQQAIDDSGGSISFQQYMQMALYEPELGYYVAGLDKFGEHGDFVTAPEISPLFSQCIAHQIAPVVQSEKGTQVLEFGAGSGIMAADILIHLEKLDALPHKYLILDLSPDLQQRQHQMLEQRAPHLLKQVEWIHQLPHKFTGVILANEVLDAMPVELFSIEHDRINMLHVTNDNIQNKQLAFQKANTDDTADKLISKRCLQHWDEHYSGYRPRETYISEYNPALSGWISSLSDMLTKGLILIIDYGYERSQYYQPERQQGTLLCHYQHHVHDKPLLWPGLQDITASVDFTAVAEAADDAGLTVAAYLHQSDFLINNNLEALFSQAINHNPQQQYQLAQQVRTLTLPSEMGERFKVMALTKGFTLPSETLKLADFSRTDQRHRL